MIKVAPVTTVKTLEPQNHQYQISIQRHFLLVYTGLLELLLLSLKVTNGPFCIPSTVCEVQLANRVSPVRQHRLSQTGEKCLSTVFQGISLPISNDPNTHSFPPIT